MRLGRWLDAAARNGLLKQLLRPSFDCQMKEHRIQNPRALSTFQGANDRKTAKLALEG
jgi:hypothetical protein